MLTSSRRQFSLASRQVSTAILAMMLTATASFAAPRNAQGNCQGPGESRAVVAGVDERLDVALEDGRVLRLAGVDPPRPTPEAPERDVLARDRLAAIRGRAVSFTPLAPKPDRWGRIPALVFVDALDHDGFELDQSKIMNVIDSNDLEHDAAGKPGSRPSFPHPAPAVADHSIAAMLLKAGLGRVRPQAEIRPCLKIWLADEADARAARLGLWADPYYAILAADEGSAFAEKAATDIIVEGRLAGVVASRTGLRLEFGPGRSRSFSVIISQRNVRIFEQAGMKFNSLIGRNLRVRGLLDMRFGPQIEIASPDEIELIAGEENKAELKAEASKSDAITLVPPKEP